MKSSYEESHMKYLIWKCSYENSHITWKAIGLMVPFRIDGSKYRKSHKRAKTPTKQAFCVVQKNKKIKVISGSLENVPKPYKNHCFCTSGVDRWMHFLSNPHASMGEIMAGTMKTLGKTTHSMCFHVRRTEPHESWRSDFRLVCKQQKHLGKAMFCASCSLSGTIKWGVPITYLLGIPQASKLLQCGSKTKTAF